ncbi:MAG TPA: amidohydrolase family protein, partial [Christiangramia sp.]|nr:amidohydrolase family protein [Christiangramia sp.]
LEIINGERFVTSHSYIQSEINMLMTVAEKFGFNINTFTHILEGYKVADKMKEHGVGASTFSDWWAYKYEVNDAIPYNAAIMNEVGLIVAINSDDGEMSRRLNQEAAKSVKYGGMSEEDAWKMVTINPAKLLHVDNLVGSIKTGKQADLVLWNEHPLSIYAKPEKTMVEGVIYFDIDRDSEMRKDIKMERNELIGQMLKAKNNGVKTQPVIKKEKQRVHCDLLEEVK